MRSAIGAEELLRAWERGDGHPSFQRMLAMLEMSPVPREPAALTVGARDAALLELRQRLFGDRFLSVTHCAACQEAIELTFDADDVIARGGSAGAEEQALTLDDCDVTFRLPTVADLAAAERTGDLALGREVLLRRCVSRAAREGEAIDAAALPAEVVTAIGERMAQADPQADVRLDLTCPSCGHQWREPFDVASFLWMEIQSSAQHLLADVHAIASAYGWSEQAILALSPARRNAYLEMVR
jgi:hypothetical protein